MSDLEQIGRLAKKASKELAIMGTTQKNQALAMVADGLERDTDIILSENEKDM